jgi:uncharacterized membrane protein YeaQ/YmgE (transglycosylase-associated protein family)
MQQLIFLAQVVTPVQAGPETVVTISFTPTQILTWLFVGVIAGALASALVRGRGMSFMSSLIVGLIGALLGGFLFTFLRIPLSPSLASEGIVIRWIDLIVAFIGAVIVLVLFGGLFTRYRR